MIVKVGTSHKQSDVLQPFYEFAIKFMHDNSRIMSIHTNELQLKKLGVYVSCWGRIYKLHIPTAEVARIVHKEISLAKYYFHRAA